MPLSTSSKTIDATEPVRDKTFFNARIIRDNSPPMQSCLKFGFFTFISHQIKFNLIASRLFK